MRFQVNSTGNIILANKAFMDAQHPGDFTLIPDPVPTAAEARKVVVLARLEEIDTIGDKPRTRRELTLSKAATKSWLQTLDDEAVTLRAELPTLG